MPASGPVLAAIYRVLVVDDHPIVRLGLTHLIDSEPDMETCGDAASVVEVLDLVHSTAPDLAIVDLMLKDESGLTLIGQLRALCPDVKVLVSSIHDEATYATRALQAGAAGYIEKRAPIPVLLQAIRQVLSGRVYLSPLMARDLLQHAVNGKVSGVGPASALSNRELEIFEMIGRGLSIKDIAGKLDLSPKTVESHRQHIKEKLSFAKSVQLSRCAFEWVRDQA